jgi:hypothetical protein
MKPKLILLFLFQSILMNGQTEMKNDKYNFDKDCFDGDQQDINICYSKAITKFSKVMEKKYNCIISYFDTQIKYYSNNDKEIESEYAKMKAKLISSQNTWEKLKEQNSDFYDGGGGTETPMLIGQSIVKDYKDRLTWLDNLIEEEGQGNEMELLKCE